MPEGVEPVERESKYPDISDLIFEAGDVPIIGDDGITIIGKKTAAEVEAEAKAETKEEKKTPENKPDISLRNIL